jgi:hypothetical protein
MFPAWLSGKSMKSMLGGDFKYKFFLTAATHLGEAPDLEMRRFGHSPGPVLYFRKSGHG